MLRMNECAGEAGLAAARPTDFAAIRALLAANGLPEADLTAEHLGHFWVHRDAAGIGGVIGLERYGTAALLRSLAVRADLRARGIGSRLLAHAESQAAALGVKTLYLLTTTAERFFTARGYARTRRESAPPTIRATREFSELCPSTSACLSKRVGDQLTLPRRPSPRRRPRRSHRAASGAPGARGSRTSGP